jgi:hypothetical protein
MLALTARIPNGTDAKMHFHVIVRRYPILSLILTVMVIVMVSSARTSSSLSVYIPSEILTDRRRLEVGVEDVGRTRHALRIHIYFVEYEDEAVVVLLLQPQEFGYCGCLRPGDKMLWCGVSRMPITTCR